MSVRQGLPPRRVSTPLSPTAAADLANPYRLQAGRASNDGRTATQSAAAAASAAAAPPPPPPPQRVVPPPPPPPLPSHHHHHHHHRASRAHSPTAAAAAAATPQRRMPSPSPPPPPPPARRQQQQPHATRDGIKGEAPHEPAVQAALEQLAQRLSSAGLPPRQPPPQPRHLRRFDSVYDLKTWMAHEFDPNRTGTLGVGEFMCVWLWGHPIARKRYHVVGSSGSGSGSGGGSAVSPQRRRDAGTAAAASGTLYPPSALPYPPAKVAAVAAFLVGRVLKREADLELLDHRTDAEKRREKLWYGGAAAWRWEEPVATASPPADGAAGGAASSGTALYFTHATLLALRRAFEPFQDVQGGVRFGNISAFLHEVSRDAALRGSLHFTHEDVESVLDTIVRHVEVSLPPAPRWVEPSISFMILLSLVLRFSAAAADRAELSALFNEGLAVFNALAGGGTEEVAQLPIRVLLLAVASASPHSFTDTRVEGVDVSAAVLAPTPLKAW